MASRAQNRVFTSTATDTIAPPLLLLIPHVSWGSNPDGQAPQTGCEAFTGDNKPPMPPDATSQPTAEAIRRLATTNWNSSACVRTRLSPADGAYAYVSVSAGAEQTCALASNGAVDCWGGESQPNTTTRSPSDSSSIAYTAVSAGVYNTFACAVTTGGAIECTFSPN